MVFEAIRMDEAIKRDHGIRRKEGLGLSPEKHSLGSSKRERLWKCVHRKPRGIQWKRVL